MDMEKAKQDAIKEFAVALAAKIMDDQQVCAGVSYGQDNGIREVITNFLECESTSDAPHDWIGEALSRRLECASAIKKIGDANLEITALKDELEQERQTVAELREANTVLDNRLGPVDDVDADLTIAKAQLAVAEAMLNKERKRHRKLQRDVSTFLNVLGKGNDCSLTSQGLLMLLDDVREGRISQ